MSTYWCARRTCVYSYGYLVSGLARSAINDNVANPQKDDRPNLGPIYAMLTSKNDRPANKRMA